MTTATSKYSSIRKDIAKDTILRKFDPNEKHWNSKRELVPYRSETYFRKDMEKEYAKKMAELDKIESASLPIEGQVTVTRSPSKGTYGYQWKAVFRYTYLYNGRIAHEVIEGEYTDGIGYDKISTAIAKVYNKSPSMLKILCDARAKKLKIPYGASLNTGMPYLPYWDRGVGAECYVKILNTLGYNAQEVRTGSDTVYIYTFSKKRKTAAEKGRL